MDRGYVRETRGGPSVAQQLDGLRRFGVQVDGDHAPVYRDLLSKNRKHRPAGGEALTDRAKIIRDMRPGSALVVYSLDRLGVSAGDIRAVLDEMQDHGYPVRIVVKLPGDDSKGEGTTVTADTPRMLLAAACLKAEADLKRERIKPARAVREARGIKGGAKGKPLAPEVHAKAAEDWFNVGPGSLSAAEMQAKYDRSPRWFRDNIGRDRGKRPGRRKKSV